MAQPNRVSPGAAWLVYGYKHPDMSDTQAWRNTTEWVTFFHGSLWYGAQNIMKNNYILPSAKEELGHRNLHYQGEAGVYTSPHMYTSIYYAEPHVLFEDGVYTGVCFINLQLVVSLFFTRRQMVISMCLLPVRFRSLMCGCSLMLLLQRVIAKGDDPR